MILTAEPLSEAYAKEVCGWRYPAPYDSYNLPDWETVKNEGWSIADGEKRKNEYFSVLDGGAFIGFLHLSQRDRCVMIGCGLRPDFCGRGIGRDLISLALEKTKSRFGDTAIRLSVRAFNERAVKCYRHMGFVEIGRQQKVTFCGTYEMILMEYRA